MITSIGTCCLVYRLEDLQPTGYCWMMLELYSAIYNWYCLKSSTTGILEPWFAQRATSGCVFFTWPCLHASKGKHHIGFCFLLSRLATSCITHSDGSQPYWPVQLRIWHASKQFFQVSIRRWIHYIPLSWWHPRQRPRLVAELGWKDVYQELVGSRWKDRRIPKRSKHKDYMETARHGPDSVTGDCVLVHPLAGVIIDTLWAIEEEFWRIGDGEVDIQATSEYFQPARRWLKEAAPDIHEMP